MRALSNVWGGTNQAICAPVPLLYPTRGAHVPHLARWVGLAHAGCRAHLAGQVGRTEVVEGHGIAMLHLRAIAMHREPSGMS